MDQTSIPKIQEAAGANNNYSTLEVAIGAPDYDKEVVHPPHYPSVAQDSQPYYQQQYHDAQQIQGLQNGATWGTGAETGPDTTASTVDDERRILGLKRRTFFILAWAVSLLLAIGIGVGAGLGATMKSRNEGDSQAAGAATTSETDLAAITGPPTTRSHSRTPGVPDAKDTALTVATSTNTNVNNSPTNRPPPPPESEPPKTSSTTPITPPPTTTNPPPTTSTPPPDPTTSTKPPKVGGSGGRCQNEWGSDCICLDDGICVNKWKGTPYTGFEGNWPCPGDPDNIMACVVKPCLGQDVSGQTQCLWREGCSKLAEVGTSVFFLFLLAL
ncbi:hypothetical protein V8F33_011931 [Rhypophila sp. PSN 637]